MLLSYSLLWRETVIVRVEAGLVVISAELDAVLEVRTGAEHLPQVGINIPGFPVVISLENLREEHNHAEIVSFFSDDLVMLQNPVVLLRYVGPQQAGG